MTWLVNSAPVRLNGAFVPQTPVVFVTAYDSYALEAFEVSAVDYLLKPISRERLVLAIEKARRYHGIPRTAAASA